MPGSKVWSIGQINRVRLVSMAISLKDIILQAFIFIKVHSKSKILGSNCYQIKSMVQQRAQFLIAARSPIVMTITGAVSVFLNGDPLRLPVKTILNLFSFTGRFFRTRKFLSNVFNYYYVRLKGKLWICKLVILVLV